MDSTVEYYDDNAKEYFENTINIDMLTLYSVFKGHLPLNVSILDLGCGGGRDTKYFLSKGYTVTAIDASEKMCKLASLYTGTSVKNKRIEEISLQNEFDGIWASASLLHIEKKVMIEALQKCINALKRGGVL